MSSAASDVYKRQAQGRAEAGRQMHTWPMNLKEGICKGKRDLAGDRLTAFSLPQNWPLSKKKKVLDRKDKEKQNHFACRPFFFS